MIAFFALCLAAWALFTFVPRPLALSRRRGLGSTATAHPIPPVFRGGLLVVAVVVVVVAGPSFFIWQKVIGRTLMPLGLVWAATIALALWRLASSEAPNSERRRPAFGLLLTAGTLTLLGSEPLGQVLMRSLEADFRADPLVQAHQMAAMNPMDPTNQMKPNTLNGTPFDAVLVLGGGASQGPDGSVELGPAGDRIYLGARLYHRGFTPLLLTTGTAIAGFSQTFDSTNATRILWRDVGIPDEAIVGVGDTRNTREEAVAVSALIRERHFKRVGIVSSAWHLRRVMKLFNDVDDANPTGATLVPLAADHRGEPTWEGIYSLIPIGNGAWMQQKAVWEFLGAATGR